MTQTILKVFNKAGAIPDLSKVSDDGARVTPITLASDAKNVGFLNFYNISEDAEDYNYVVRQNEKFKNGLVETLKRVDEIITGAIKLCQM